MLLEGDPFAVVEAMTIAAYATGCERGYLYVRGEYPLARDAHRRTRSRRPRERGFLGSRHPRATASPSTSSCATAPARTSAARRRRSSTRSRATAASRATSRRSRSSRGLFGQPTVVNNVETLVNVLPIVLEGGPAYAADRHARSRPGPKLFCVSGRGRHARDLRGAVRDARCASCSSWRAGSPGRTCRPCCWAAPPAASSTPDDLDLRLTFEDARESAPRSARASCWRSTTRSTDRAPAHGHRRVLPRRELRAVRAVPRRDRAPGGGGRAPALGPDAAAASQDELALIREIGQAMRDASICGLGQTASSAIESAIERLGAVHDMTQRTVEPHDRRPARRGARGHDDPRRVPKLGIDTPTLCYGETLHARQRVPRVRGRGRGRARARAGVLAQGRGEHGGQDRLRARAPQPQDGARVPRLVGRPVDHSPAPRSTSRRYDADPARYGPPAPPRPEPRPAPHRPPRGARRADRRHGRTSR